MAHGLVKRILGEMLSVEECECRYEMYNGPPNQSVLVLAIHQDRVAGIFEVVFHEVAGVEEEFAKSEEGAMDGIGRVEPEPLGSFGVKFVV